MTKGGAMKTKQRILLGALGGITPYIVTLLSIDFENVVVSYNIFDWLGLAVRCLVLVFLGSLVAYLHRKEVEPFKIFQLGLAAPALVATIINGNPGNYQNFPTLKNHAAIEISILNKAYAGELSNPINKGMFRKPDVSSSSRFIRGVFGKKIQTAANKWFVIVSSHKKYEDAKKQAENLKSKNYIAKVYRPFGNSPNYSVAIAANVSLKEAEAVRALAIKNGLPTNTYLWSY